MAKKLNAETVSAPRGVGGTYTTDPITGIRTLVKPATSRIPPCMSGKLTLSDPPATAPEPELTPEPAA